MNAVEVSGIGKSFGETRAVEDVSFSVEPGEIFGMLGPNGSGKTTTIRMILDLFRPDRGTVAVLGGPMNEEKKGRIGYMPEERGLYQDLPIERCLLYLASLKGLPSAEARRRLAFYLDRFDLASSRKKKIKQLSKGMQQKAQLIATVLAEPELLIVDEPFSGLDPVNTQLVKEVFDELRRRGTTILMSTHQMNLVEELCDRIVLIDRGRNLLYGRLDEIRRGYAGDAVIVRATGALPDIPGTRPAGSSNGDRKLDLEKGTGAQDVLRTLVAQGIVLERFEIALPSLDEVFVRVVREGRA